MPKNKPTSRSDEVPEPAATYERTDNKTTKKEGETSVQGRSEPLPTSGPVRGDMLSEEPLGWDQGPQDIHDPEKKRHPRKDGVGGSEPADSQEEAKRDERRDRGT